MKKTKRMHKKTKVSIRKVSRCMRKLRRKGMQRKTKKDTVQKRCIGRFKRPRRKHKKTKRRQNVKNKAQM